MHVVYSARCTWRVIVARNAADFVKQVCHFAMSHVIGVTATDLLTWVCVHTKDDPDAAESIVMVVMPTTFSCRAGGLFGLSTACEEITFCPSCPADR